VGQDDRAVPAEVGGSLRARVDLGRQRVYCKGPLALCSNVRGKSFFLFLCGSFAVMGGKIRLPQRRTLGVALLANFRQPRG
jgi:hypothetical protein